MSYLVDTNVISETRKGARCNPHVAAWYASIANREIYLSVLVVGEIRKGIDLLPENEPKRGALQSWLDLDLRVRFAGRLLAFDEWVAERWGQIEALARRHRMILPTIDAQLAATALHHGLTFVTRNTTDVRSTGVSLFNPWSAARE